MRDGKRYWLVQIPLHPPQARFVNQQRWRSARSGREWCCPCPFIAVLSALQAVTKVITIHQVWWGYSSTSRVLLQTRGRGQVYPVPLSCFLRVPRVSTLHLVYRKRANRKLAIIPQTCTYGHVMHSIHVFATSKVYAVDNKQCIPVSHLDGHLLSWEHGKGQGAPPPRW